MQKQSETEVQNHNRMIMYACMFFITPVVIGFSSYFRSMQAEIILRNVILSMIGIGLVIFLMLQSDIKKDYLFDNEVHLGRFCNTYILALLLSAGVSQFSEYITLLPYMIFAALFLLFSNFHIGLITYTHFIFITAIISRLDMKYFSMYLIIGLGGICLLRMASQCFKMWYQFVVFSLQYVLLYILIFILPDYHHFNQQQMIWFVAGYFVNIVILLPTLRIVDMKVIRKYDTQYEWLSNPDHELMIKLKESAKNEYYNAIHTAYLSSRLAKILNCNEILAKTGGYYHRIGVIREGDRRKNSIEIGKEYQFPPQLLHLIDEYGGKHDLPTLKESVIIILADAVVTTIHYFYEKNDAEKPDYDKIIEVVFRKKYEGGILEHADITFDEYRKMKEYFKSEELYYDFLR